MIIKAGRYFKLWDVGVSSRADLVLSRQFLEARLQGSNTGQCASVLKLFLGGSLLPPGCCCCCCWGPFADRLEQARG